jgi:transposase-like protein
MRKSLPDPEAVWTDGDARRVLAAWERTTEPLAAFARAHGFGVNRLYWWRKRFASEPAPLPPALVPALVTRAEEISVVVRIANNVSIEIANASPRVIAELISELGRSGS